ncbi:MAG: pyruvate kinase alpha/beta domain-containing protein, partial [Coriobacteriales bacterium]
TPDETVARQLALVWGTKAVVVPQRGTIEGMLSHVVTAVVDAGLVSRGSLVALTAGVAVGVKGGTNLVEVVRA